MSYLNLGQRNKLSLNNSTATPLIAGGIFTGVADDALLYNSVQISAKTDQEGSISVQFSVDGINWDETIQYKFRSTSGYAMIHKFTILKRYFRLVVTNTSLVGQAFFRMQVILVSGAGSLVVPGNSVIPKEADSIPVRLIDPKLELSAGLRESIAPLTIQGSNISIAVGSATVWNVAGTWNPQLVARTLSCVSTNAADTAVGTGARTIVISGVNAARNLITETVIMDGLNPVITVNTWFGVNSITVATAGSVTTNVGNITLTSTIDAFIQGRIIAGEGQSYQAIYHVPTGYSAAISTMNTTVTKTGGGGQPKCNVDLWMVTPAGVKTLLMRNFYEPGMMSGNNKTFQNYITINPGSYIWVSATTDTNNTVIAVRMEALRVQA
jgi:hypothetical protein